MSISSACLPDFLSVYLSVYLSICYSVSLFNKLLNVKSMETTLLIGSKTLTDLAENV